MSRRRGGSLVIGNRTLRFSNVSDKAILVIQLRHVVELIKGELRPVKRRSLLLRVFVVATICGLISGGLLLLSEQSPPGGADEWLRLLRRYRNHLGIAAASAKALALATLALKILGKVLGALLRALGWRRYGLMIRTSLDEALTLESRNEGAILRILEEIVQRMELEATAASRGGAERPPPPITFRNLNMTLGDKITNVVNGNFISAGQGAHVEGVTQTQGG